MNLDDFSAFQQLDTQNMLAHIDGLPDQLQTAWELSRHLPLPEMTGIRQILIAGMGGSAIGADLLSAYIAPNCPLPVAVHRDYELPGWAQGKETLFIASSHSGNTEETLSAFETARERGCQILTISTGGKLEAESAAGAIPNWKFDHKGQPRAAVGFSFGLLLGLFDRLGLIPNPALELKSALVEMRQQQAGLLITIPAAQNPAKRMAGQLVGRLPVILGSGFLAPVSRRWKGQISEVAKAWAQFEYLPEADHNTMAGLSHPEEVLQRMIILFLRAPSDHPRNRLRADLTRKGFMLEGLNTDFIDAAGDTPLAHIWTTLHMGDYVSYYLAMAYGVDPTPIPAIEGLKAEMK